MCIHFGGMPVLPVASVSVIQFFAGHGQRGHTEILMEIIDLTYGVQLNAAGNWNLSSWTQAGVLTWGTQYCNKYYTS
jgi:hypothetical protein